jgi:chitodextrinase
MSGIAAPIGAAPAPGLLAPTNLSAKSVTGSSLELNWKNPLENTAVTEYEVYSGTSLLTTTAVTKATLSGLTNATTYSLSVKACEGVGVCSPLSSSINVRTLDTEKPTKPVKLYVSNITSNSLRLNWEASTDNVGVAGYKVYINDALYEDVNKRHSYVTGLSADTTYSIKVLGYDEANNESEFSVVKSAKTFAVGGPIVDTVAPSIPQNLVSLNVQMTSFRLKWSYATDNIGIKEYEVYRNGQFIAKTEDRVFLFTGIVPASTNLIRVLAVDHYGNKSLLSNVLTVTTQAGNAFTETTAPTTPTNLASNGVTSTGFTINWTRSTDNVYVLGYNIYRNGKYITSVSGNSYTFVGLTANTAHQVRILAYDVAKNRSSLTTAINVTTNP